MCWICWLDSWSQLCCQVSAAASCSHSLSNMSFWNDSGLDGLLTLSLSFFFFFFHN
ncbi:hypothetical protein Hanom_Chr16g01469701 [Helianthus anomalus]